MKHSNGGKIFHVYSKSHFVKLRKFLVLQIKDRAPIKQLRPRKTPIFFRFLRYLGLNNIPRLEKIISIQWQMRFYFSFNDCLSCSLYSYLITIEGGIHLLLMPIFAMPNKVTASICPILRKLKLLL